MPSAPLFCIIPLNLLGCFKWIASSQTCERCVGKQKKKGDIELTCGFCRLETCSSNLVAQFFFYFPLLVSAAVTGGSLETRWKRMHDCPRTHDGIHTHTHIYIWTGAAACVCVWRERASGYALNRGDDFLKQDRRWGGGRTDCLLLKTERRGGMGWRVEGGVGGRLPEGF